MASSRFQIAFRDFCKSIVVIMTVRSTILTMDFHTLQTDLDSLSSWCNVNLHVLKIHPQKSFSYSYDTQNNTVSTPAGYLLNDLPLPSCVICKDLGVMVSSDVSWSNHYKHIVSGALRELGLIRRSFAQSHSVQAKLVLYNSLIKSKLLYCSQVWRPRGCLATLSFWRAFRGRPPSSSWVIIHPLTKIVLAFNLLPLAMQYELNDIMFFIHSLKSPSPAFNILDHATFCSSSTRSGAHHKLSYNQIIRSLTTGPISTVYPGYGTLFLLLICLYLFIVSNLSLNPFYFLIFLITLSSTQFLLIISCALVRNVCINVLPILITYNFYTLF